MSKKLASEGNFRPAMTRKSLLADKVTLYRWLALVALSLAGDGWTYEAGVTGSIIQLPAYVTHLGYVGIIPDNINQWIGPIYTLGQLFGGLFAAFVSDKYGRKMVMYLGSFMVILSTTLMIISSSVALVLVARVIQGVSIGFLLLGYQIYAVELAAPNDRGFVSTFSLVTGNIFGTIAACVIFGITYVTGNWGWRFSLGIAYIPSTVLFVVLWYVPESPRWLYQQGRVEEARKILGTFHGFANGTRKDPTFELGPDAQREFDCMRAAIDDDKARGHDKWSALWSTPSARYRLFGSSILTYYYTQVFAAAGITSYHLSFGIGCLLNVAWIIGGIIGGISLDYLGRRFNYIFGLGQMGVCLLAQGIIAIKCFDGVETPSKVAGGLWVTLYMIQWTLWVAFFSSAVNLLPAELWPAGLRARGFALSNVVSMSVGFATQYSALPMYRQLQGKTWIVFSAIMLAAAALVWFTYPEPKMLTLEEIDVLFGADSSDAISSVTGRSIRSHQAPIQRIFAKKGRVAPFGTHEDGEYDHEEDSKADKEWTERTKTAHLPVLE